MKLHSPGLIIIASLVGLLASCQGRGAEGPGYSLDLETPLVSMSPSGPTLAPTASSTPTPSLTPTPTPVVILDPDPVVVEFKAEDGAELSGLYYPAGENPAPLIVLLHWARGDQLEWQPIAFWLQNRGLLQPTPDYNHSWKSPLWYPEYSLERPIGVFTFTFRSCAGACQSYSPIEWLLDVQAALQTAAGLPGVDPDWILTAGASIGADGAVYGCAWFNQQGLGRCRGSFLLSPSSLLTLPFDQVVADLLGQEPPLPVYCLYGLRDDASLETCSDVPGLTIVDYGYIENHGLELLQPEQGPDPLDLLLEFLDTALAGE